MQQKSLNATDLNLFKVLSSVYSQRNLTNAGNKIGMSQPAVSRALDRLSHLFGERLFVRINGEMRPTRTTEMILPIVDEALSLLETSINLTKKFEPNHLRTTLKFGLNDYSLAIIFPKLFCHIKQHSPNINFSAVSTSYLDAPVLLRKGEIDCAVVSSLIEGYSFDTDPLFEEDYVVISSKSHFAHSEKMDLETYLSCEHILVSYSGQVSGWVDETLLKLGHKRKISTVVHSFHSVPLMLLNQPYLCAMPRRLAKHFATHYDIMIHEMPFESKKHTFYFVRCNHLTQNAISNWVRDQFIETCKMLDENI